MTFVYRLFRPIKIEGEAKTFIKEIEELHQNENHNLSTYFVTKQKFRCLHVTITEKTRQIQKASFLNT